MHLVVVYCAAHRAILRTAYHIARDGTVAGQSSLHLRFFWTGEATGGCFVGSGCAVAGP